MKNIVFPDRENTIKKPAFLALATMFVVKYYKSESTWLVSSVCFNSYPAWSM